ncbi:MAG: Stp1/IreP family PP2C-type Ser/Thr phosphatase [Sandaracinaceae bacterium]|nr:Stp1/IreP family PP2C-type Ser/Thr phosphatase [Sandaracinaceae bacterium]
MASRARVIALGETDVGKKRSVNEDSFMILDDHLLYVVADGMGGHASGEVASRMAIETLRDFFAATADDPEATWPYKMDQSRGYEENRLITSIKLANLRIFEAAQRDPALHGMGTTVVSILVIDEGVLIAHVGDSRVYRFRNNHLDLLTEDHSLVNDYIKMGRLSSPEEIENFPHKNIILRALGMKETVLVDTFLDKPQPGDIYVLCSDGLAGPASDDEILEVLRQHSDLKTATQKLIQKANDNGGPDNITCILAKVMGVG